MPIVLKPKTSEKEEAPKAKGLTLFNEDGELTLPGDTIADFLEAADFSAVTESPDALPFLSNPDASADDPYAALDEAGEGEEKEGDGDKEKEGDDADKGGDGYQIVAIARQNRHRGNRGQREPADEGSNVGSVAGRPRSSDVVANVHRNFDVAAVETNRNDVRAAAEAATDQQLAGVLYEHGVRRTKCLRHRGGVAVRVLEHQRHNVVDHVTSTKLIDGVPGSVGAHKVSRSAKSASERKRLIWADRRSR